MLSQASLRHRVPYDPILLDVLRQRYVVERRPLEASVEQVLRADSRAGARAILALIDTPAGPVS